MHQGKDDELPADSMQAQRSLTKVWHHCSAAGVWRACGNVYPCIVPEVHGSKLKVSEKLDLGCICV